MGEMNTKKLKLDDQLCFPLYACSREVIKAYKPYLDKLELTYTQYIVMIVLWSRKFATVKELGKDLYLDSGTLTPLLKKLEAKGLLTRARSVKDERNLIVTITEAGEKLRDKALGIPEKAAAGVPLPAEDAQVLYALLNKLLASFGEDNK